MAKRRATVKHRSNAPKGFTTFVANNWWKLLTGLVTVMVAASGWLTATCLTERSQQANEFRQAILSLRLTDEKSRQATASLIETYKSFVEYVERGNLSALEIKRREDQISAGAQTANAECNTAKQAWYTYRIALENVGRHFLWPKPPDWREVVSGPAGDTRCEEFLRISQGQSMPDSTKLVSSPAYRRTFIEAQQPYVSTLDEKIEQLKQGQIQRDRDNERLIGVVEYQNATVARRVSGCLRLLFRLD